MREGQLADDVIEKSLNLCGGRATCEVIGQQRERTYAVD